VIDIHTGAIKAMVSTPTIDPNVMSGRISHKEWDTLINHPRTPLT
jgi:penicillin-binding protein 2